MKAGKDNASNDENEHDFAQDLICHFESCFDYFIQTGQRARKAHPSFEALNYNRYKFDVKYVQIDHHAHGHFKQYRISIPVINRAGDIPVTADIHHQSQDHKSVSQHGRQQGWPDYGMILVTIEYIGNSTRGKSAGRKGDPGGYINADPYAPGGLIVEVGYRANAEKKSCHGKSQSHSHKR